MERRKTIRAYAVSKNLTVPWLGTDKKKNEKRKIDLTPNDILILSNDGKHYNRLNRGAINIRILKKHIVDMGNIEFNDEFWKKGWKAKKVLAI